MTGVTGSSAPIQAQIYAMKKGQDVKEQGVMSALNSAAVHQTDVKSTTQASTVHKTGLGQSLDLLA